MPIAGLLRLRGNVGVESFALLQQGIRTGCSDIEALPVMLACYRHVVWFWLLLLNPLP